MAKKSDVDLQTFQIYQDEETHDHPPEDTTPKKKKFGISFKKKEKIASNAVDAENDTDEHPSDSVSVNSGGNAKQIIIGLILGIAIVALIVIADKLMR